MTAQGVDYLAKMANEIARNLGAIGDEATVAAGVANHLNRFWSPAMRRELVEHAREDDSGLLPAVKLALIDVRV